MLGVVCRQHGEGIEVDPWNERHVVGPPERKFHGLGGRLERELPDIEAVGDASEPVASGRAAGQVSPALLILAVTLARYLPGSLSPAGSRALIDSVSAVTF
jgi:hypothetical protein